MSADRRWLAGLLLALGLALTGPGALAAQVEPAAPAAVRTPAVDLQARLKDVEVVERGGRLYVRPDEDAELVPGEAWLRALAAAEEEQRAHGLVFVLLNITHPWSLVWIAVGLGGQALFMLRMLLQWYASERQQRSVIPVGFWWGSLAGGILLFTYFCWRKDAVGILGQSTGIFVYARNLVLIRRAGLAVSAAGPGRAGSEAPPEQPRAGRATPRPRSSSPSLRTAEPAARAPR